MTWKKFVLPILVAILVILGTALTAFARPHDRGYYGRGQPYYGRVYPRYPAYRYYSPARPYYGNPYVRPYYPAYPYGYTSPYGYPYQTPYPYYVNPYPGFGIGGPNWSLRFGF